MNQELARIDSRTLTKLRLCLIRIVYGWLWEWCALFIDCAHKRQVPSVKKVPKKTYSTLSVFEKKLKSCRGYRIMEYNNERQQKNLHFQVIIQITPTIASWNFSFFLFTSSNPSCHFIEWHFCIVVTGVGFFSRLINSTRNPQSEIEFIIKVNGIAKLLKLL